MPLPSHDVIVSNLRAIRASSTPDQVREGRAWYPAMGRLIATIGQECAEAAGTEISREFAVGVFAAYSQNATWKANVTMATRYLTTRELRGMGCVTSKLSAMEAGTDPGEAMGGALKLTDFYRNLIGEDQFVTCDRWHIQAATGDRITLTPKVRDAITRATHEVAREFGESASACQAVIWCTVRPSGNGK